MSTIDECLEQARQQHETEVAMGFEVWGQATKNAKSCEEDYPCEKIEVPLSSIGPDGMAFFSQNNYIYQTQQPIFTATECQALIDESKHKIAQDLSQMEGSSSNDEVSHAELNEARLSTLPNGKLWLQTSMQEKLFPLISSLFGIPVEDLTCQDALCIGYHPNAIPSAQPIHRDASLITCNIALSPLSSSTSSSDTDKSGTFIEPLQQTLQNEQGHVMTHLGGIMHAGVGKASRTERWVLVVFCLAKHVPQLSRYCHKMGMDQLLDYNNLDMAKHYYLAGLTESPHDILLHRSLGNLYLRFQQTAETFQQTKQYNQLAKHHFRQAVHHYPYNVEAYVTLGKIFSSEKRPRAALRYFDLALSNPSLQNTQNKMRSLQAMAWETQMLAAKCAIMCASWEEHYYKDQPLSRTWSQKHLPVALSRIESCLSASPQNESLHKMYSQTQYLLHQSTQPVEQSSQTVSVK